MLSICLNPLLALVVDDFCWCTRTCILIWPHMDIVYLIRLFTTIVLGCWYIRQYKTVLESPVANIFFLYFAGIYPLKLQRPRYGSNFSAIYSSTEYAFLQSQEKGRLYRDHTISKHFDTNEVICPNLQRICKICFFHASEVKQIKDRQ